LAQTGSLLTSGTSLWCPVLPSRSPSGLLALSPSTLSRLSLVVTLPFVCVFPQSGDATELSPPLGWIVRVFSSALLPGFSGPESSVLHADLSSSAPFPIRVSPSRVRFMTPPGNNRSQNRRTSPGKIAPPPHIPSCFTSVRFTGYQDSLWYACSSSSPLPFSRFAVRYVHGFCLMLPPDTPSLGMPLPCWRCPSVR